MLASRHHCLHSEACGSLKDPLNGLPVEREEVKVTDHLPLIVALNTNNCTLDPGNRSTCKSLRGVGKREGVDKLILIHLEEIEVVKTTVPH